MKECPAEIRERHPDWAILDELLAKAKANDELRDWFVKLGAKAYMAKYMGRE